jgi:hypothetical protein
MVQRVSILSAFKSLSLFEKRALCPARPLAVTSTNSFVLIETYGVYAHEFSLIYIFLTQTKLVKVIILRSKVGFRL